MNKFYQITSSSLLSEIRIKLAFLGLHFCLFTSLGLYFFLKDYQLNAFDLRLGFGIMITSTFLFLLHLKNNIRGQYFVFSVIFLFGFIIVHFQMYLDFLLGNYLPLTMPMFSIYDVGMKGFLMANVSLQAFYTGYFYMTIVKKNRSKVQNYSIEQLHFKGIIIILTTLFIGYLGFSEIEYFKGGYSVVDQPIPAYYFEYYFQLSFIAYLISYTLWFKSNVQIKSVTQYIKKFNKVPLVIFFIYILLVFSSGDRGPAIYLSFGIIISYIYATQKKVPFYVLLIFGFASIFLLFLIGFSREMKGETNISIGKLLEARKVANESTIQLSVSPLTMEYARVIRAYHGGIDYIEQNGYHYGELTLYKLIGTIPGLGRSYQYVSNKDTWELQTSKIITHHLYGYNSSHGLGTTSLIDIYMDFGFVGSLIIYLLFGSFARRIDEFTIQANSVSLFGVTMLFVFVANSYYIPRGSILDVLRDGFIVFCILKFSILVNRSLR